MAEPEPRRGRYLALEGIEGAGKSTVAASLADHLEATGRVPVRVREPGGTALGEGIRALLLDGDEALAPWAEAMLFAAARAQLARQVVVPALAAGQWVVSDRSVYSSLAYQGVGRGLGTSLVRQVNAAGLGEAWPDLVILLRLPPEQGLARQAVADRIGSEGLHLHRAVAQAFDTLAGDEPERFAVVDAARPRHAVVEEVCALVEERWP